MSTYITDNPDFGNEHMSLSPKVDRQVLEDIKSTRTDIDRKGSQPGSRQGPLRGCPDITWFSLDTKLKTWDLYLTLTGLSGVSAVSGISSVSGLSGVSAVSGLSGVSAVSGISSVSGLSGVSAISGISSVSGLSGLSGVSAGSGLSGVSAGSGLSGVSAVTGLSGVSAGSGLSGQSVFIRGHNILLTTNIYLSASNTAMFNISSIEHELFSESNYSNRLVNENPPFTGVEITSFNVTSQTSLNFELPTIYTTGDIEIILKGPGGYYMSSDSVFTDTYKLHGKLSVYPSSE